MSASGAVRFDRTLGAILGVGEAQLPLGFVESDLDQPRALRR
jgi:hypothetical protein